MPYFYDIEEPFEGEHSINFSRSKTTHNKELTFDKVSPKVTVASFSFGETSIAEDFKFLSEFLNNNAAITSLSIRVKDRFKDEVFKGLEGLLGKNKTLHKLDFHGDKIENKDLMVMSELLAENPNIASLSLSLNQIGLEAIDGLIKILSGNTLTSLNLRHNQIGVEGVGLLAKALTTDKTLTSLDLSHNEIGVEGVELLAKALGVNTTLTSLDLGTNQIGDEGVMFLANALRVNETLTSLDLTNNGIGDGVVERLASCLNSNHTLQKLCLLGNPINQGRGVKNLAAALTNQTLRDNLDPPVTSAGIKGYTTKFWPAAFAAPKSASATNLVTGQDPKQSSGVNSINPIITPSANQVFHS